MYILIKHTNHVGLISFKWAIKGIVTLAKKLIELSLIIITFFLSFFLERRDDVLGNGAQNICCTHRLFTAVSFNRPAGMCQVLVCK